MKNLFTILSVILLSIGVFAQAPQKMSYQAVIRDNLNALVTSSPIGMEISILQYTGTGNSVYTETQIPTSNINGLVSIEIGDGIPVIGSFSAIDWAAGPYYLQTEIDPTGGSNYSISGTSQLISVPYALYAAKSGSGDPWLINGNGGTISDANFIGTLTDVPFNIKVFGQNAGRIDNVSNNSFYGFLSGNATTTGQNNSAFGMKALTSNSTGHMNTSVGTFSLFSNTLANGNVAIGESALYLNTTGGYNSAVGRAALLNNTTGERNTAIGEGADVLFGSVLNYATAIGSRAYVEQSNSLILGSINGVNGATASIDVGIGTTKPDAKLHIQDGKIKIVDGTEASNRVLTSDAVGLARWEDLANILPPGSDNWALLGNTLTVANTYFIGTTDNYPLDFRVNDINAGRIDPDLDNTFFGMQTGNSITTGNDNTAIGLNALQANLGGAGNTATGSSSLLNTIGKSNTGFGFSALSINTIGSNNTGLGYNANVDSANRNNSTALGSNSLVTGSNNMILGNNNVNVGIGLSGITPGPQNKLEINSADTNASGLRFRQLTSASTPITPNPGPGVLTVDANGDVIYVEATGSSTLNIGDAYQGGIIFWLDDSGQHGLIAAIADQSTGVVWTIAPWQSTVSNAVRDGVNGGVANTERIIIQAGAGSYAAQVCANYQGGGYGDWYLPSKYELNLLFLERAWFSGFSTSNDYWSSSESTYYTAWVQFLSGSGGQASNNKDIDNNPVRAIRAF